MELLRRTGRKICSPAMYASFSRALNWVAGVRKLGRTEYKRLRGMCADRHPADGTVSQFRFPDLLHPISVRNGLSDPNEVIHTLVRETYGAHELPADQVRFVIDAGANIGDTASWFLSRYPAAMVIALEPDRANFDMLTLNCAAYQPRAVLLNAGLWSSRSRLRVVESGSRTGLTVTEVTDGSRFDCESYAPMDLLAMAGTETIDLFKIDIEGAEAALFSAPCDDWLERTRVIMIEIHGPEAEAAVRTAIGRHNYEYHMWREVHIFTNRKLQA